MARFMLPGAARNFVHNSGVAGECRQDSDLPVDGSTSAPIL